MKARVWTEHEDVGLATGYRNGVAIIELMRQLRCGRTGIYRRLKKLKIPVREPQKASGGYYKPIKISRSCEPIVRALFEEANRQWVTLQWMSEQSGICRETIGCWNGTGVIPLTANLAACGQVLGMRLDWRRE